MPNLRTRSPRDQHPKVEMAFYAKINGLLGGGLAATAAFRTGCRATTFNGAGLNALSYSSNAVISLRMPFANPL